MPRLYFILDQLRHSRLAFLCRFPEFVEFKRRSQSAETEESTPNVETAETDTPDDLMATGYLNRRSQIEEDAPERVKSCTPEFFERPVVKLITAMGYGGSLADAGRAIGNRAGALRSARNCMRKSQDSSKCGDE